MNPIAIRHMLTVTLGLCVLGARALSAECLFPGEPLEPSSIRLQKISSGFKRPVAIKFIPGFTDRYYVVEQHTGLLKLVIGTVTHATPALDLSKKIDSNNSETGFLGFAFHPQFASNGRVFINYVAKSPLTTRISEFRVDNNLMIDLASEKIILSVPQPYSNHNGGDLHFGPDGYLYIGLGDGGSGGDPQGNGQNLETYLAKMLRIDVDHGNPYAIPASNPQWPQANAKREIFATGLRNPWRFSFDRVTGELWTGDVGQDKFEEINVIKGGGNYGWRVAEGNHCYKPSTNCKMTGLTPPVIEYPRSSGASVTGGYIYRGSIMPELIGTYLYADYVSSNLWGLRYDGTKVISNKLLLSPGIAISSFGEDSSGELYALDHNGGAVYKIVRATQPLPTDKFPKKISETGCFTNLKPLTPAAGVAPYQVSSPLWSDGAAKDRWIYLPTQTGVTFSATAPWAFPEGTVLIKTFSLKRKNTTQQMESRFLVKKSGVFKGYTYRWNEQQTDGDLLSGALAVPATINVGDHEEAFEYYFPSSSDCLRCHNQSTAGALGFDLYHLNHNVDTNGGTQNQILTLKNLQIFTGSEGAIGSASDLAKLPALPDPYNGNLSLETRARSYLHTQCADCHNPTNTARQGNLDLRYETPFAKMRLCNEAPTQGDLGIANAKLLTPGDPKTSLLWIRLAPPDKQKRMPPLATNRLDEAGSELIKAWISTIKSCP